MSNATWRRCFQALVSLSCALPCVPALAQASPDKSSADKASPESLTVRCPGRVSVTGLGALESPANGFVAVLPSTSLSYLVGVAVQEGPPERRTNLVPAQLDGRQQWNIDPQHVRPTLVCRYEGGVNLTRVLSPKTKNCVTRLSPSPSDNRLAEGTGIDHAVAACS